MWSFRVRTTICPKVISKFSWVVAFSLVECWTAELAAEALQKKQINLPYYCVISCWDGFWPAGLWFAVSFGVTVENTRFLVGQQNTSLKNSLTGNATGREAILFPTSIQSKCLYQLICELTGFAGNFSPRICQIFHWGKIQSNPGKCWLFWPYDIIIGSGPSASFSNYGLSNSGRGPLFVLEIRGQTDQLNIK